MSAIAPGRHPIGTMRPGAIAPILTASTQRGEIGGPPHGEGKRASDPARGAARSGRPTAGLVTYDAKDPDTSSRRSSRCARPRARPTCSSSCSTTSASARRAPSAARAPRRPPSDWPPAGLKYNRFHTTALCSPTRAALLTGRNHHTVGMGGITEIATSAPGYNSMRPQHLRAAGRDAQAQRLLHRPVRQVPRGAGVGDEPAWGRSPVADRAAASSTSTASSAARRTSTTRRSTRTPSPVEPDRTPEEGYHFTEDMTDQAIDWVRQQKALMPDKPFFIYFAPGRDPRPAPRPDRVVGQVQGPVRRRAGTSCAKRPSSARRSSASSRRTPS